MFSHIYNILMLTLAGAVTASVDQFICCPPELGVFQCLSPTNCSCWDDESDETNPLPLTCQTYNILEEELGNSTEIQQYLETLEPGRQCLVTDLSSDMDVILSCIVEEEDDSVIGYCMICSSVFFILTAAVYAALPEARDLQGKGLINLCVSMGLGFAILSNLKLNITSDMTSCAIQVFLTYFFLLASHFWSTAISTQMSLRLRRPVVTNDSWKEFYLYALYAWGCPTVLTVGMAIVNFYPGDHMKPGIGLETCWFYDIKQQWYYMYSVMSILISINTCILVYTYIHLCQYSPSSSHVKTLKYKFVMFIRMFTIMGITWIFEMISTLTEKHIIWVVFNIINALQGLFIFTLLVFRKRVIKALLKSRCSMYVAEPVEKETTVVDDDENVIQQGDRFAWVFTRSESIE